MSILVEKIKMSDPNAIFEEYNKYESPIKIIQNNIHKQMLIQMEDNIMKVVQRYGIEVDKDELQKALKYDRQQYEKGFNDGYEASTTRWIPCSERLPKEETDVLIQWGEHSDMSTARMRDGKWYIHGIFLQHISNPEVINAWKSLPKPYKESED